MPKRDKDTRKRAERRERAKMRVQTGEGAELAVDLGEGSSTDPLQPVTAAAPQRERKAKPVEEEEKLSFTEQVADFFGPMIDFIKEVAIEARKINWPSRDESWRSTWVVLIMIVFLAAFMGAFSYGFSNVAKIIFTPKTAVSTQTGPGPGTSTPGAPTGAPSGENIPALPGSPMPTDNTGGGALPTGPTGGGGGTPAPGGQ